MISSGRGWWCAVLILSFSFRLICWETDEQTLDSRNSYGEYLLKVNTQRPKPLPLPLVLQPFRQLRTHVSGLWITEESRYSNDETFLSSSASLWTTMSAPVHDWSSGDDSNMFAVDVSFDDERDFVLRYNFREPKESEKKEGLRIQGCWKSWCPKGKGSCQKSIRNLNGKEKEQWHNREGIGVTWNSSERKCWKSKKFFLSFQSNLMDGREILSALKGFNLRSLFSSSSSDLFTHPSGEIKKSTRTLRGRSTVASGITASLSLPDVHHHQFSCHTRLYFFFTMTHMKWPKSSIQMSTGISMCGDLTSCTRVFFAAEA